MPFTIIAGFLEGFITRYSIDMPIFLSVGIILTTLAMISFYYLVYPFLVHKKQKNSICFNYTKKEVLVSL